MRFFTFNFLEWCYNRKWKHRRKYDLDYAERNEGVCSLGFTRFSCAVPQCGVRQRGGSVHRSARLENTLTHSQRWCLLDLDAVDLSLAIEPHVAVLLTTRAVWEHDLGVIREKDLKLLIVERDLYLREEETRGIYSLGVESRQLELFHSYGWKTSRPQEDHDLFTWPLHRSIRKASPGLLLLSQVFGL